MASKVFIEEINLISFGKFKDYKVEFDRGFNTIYGKNEAGKSTIQFFIKAMLYGLPTRKKSGERLKERERIINFKETYAEGIMLLSVDGRSVEIRRRFGKTAAGDKIEVCDRATGDIIPEYNDNNVGELILGIPCSVFERTMWIKQGGVFISGDEEELTSRLMKIGSSGDENISAESALTALAKEKRRLKAKDGRSAKGRIDELADRLDELRRNKYDLKTQLSQTEQIRERLSVAKENQIKTDKEIETLEKEYNMAIEAEKLITIKERVLRIDECEKRLDEIYKNEAFVKGAGLKSEDVSRARELEDKLTETDSDESIIADISLREMENSKKSSYASMLLGGGAVLSLLAFCGVFAFLIFSKIVGMIFALAVLTVGITTTIFGIRLSRECKNIKQSLLNERTEAFSKERARSDSKGEIKKEYDELLKKFGASSSAELSSLYINAQGLLERVRNLKGARQGYLGNDSYDELKELVGRVGEDKFPPADEIAELLSEKREIKLSLATEIKGLESKMAYENKITRLPSDIDTEIYATEDEIKALMHRLLVVETAEKALIEANDEWKKNFAPVLCEKVNKIIAKLTENRYNEVRINNDYQMRVDANDNLVVAEYLSCGTYEQLYLALRMAVAEMVCDNLPMFLDDILTAYDDERAESALRLIAEVGTEKQVLLFSCHTSDRDISAKLGANIINIG